MTSALAPIGYQEGGYAYDPFAGMYDQPSMPSRSGYYPLSFDPKKTDIVSQGRWAQYPSSESPTSYSGGFAPKVEYGSGYQAAKTGASALSTIGTIGSFLGAAAPVIGAISGAGALIMNWWAANKQIKAQEKAQKAQQEAYYAEQAESKRRFDIQTEMAQKAQKAEIGLATQKQAYEMQMGKEALKMQKETQRWDRMLMAMQKMMSMVPTPTARAGYSQLYRRG